MNSESSRSHLIISVVIEKCNKITGAVLRGKVRNVRYGTLYSRSTQSITDGTTCHNFYHYHYQSVIHFFKLTKYCTQKYNAAIITVTVISKIVYTSIFF